MAVAATPSVRQLLSITPFRSEEYGQVVEHYIPHLFPYFLRGEFALVTMNQYGFVGGCS